MRERTITEMMDEDGATLREARAAFFLWRSLARGLRIKRNGYVSTVWGEQSALGLYRCLVNYVENERGAAHEKAIPL